MVLDVLHPGLRQHVLSTTQLGPQRGEGTLNEVAVEVGDHADGVGQLLEVAERRTALVVDQHEGHGVGRVRRRERRDQALEQL